ncbi:hypothetical protein LC593_32195 [Nostoc sp. CHAB 5844]|nr:hypothetical protein [Nostoc sp. CHAB 5844]
MSALLTSMTLKIIFLVLLLGLGYTNSQTIYYASDVTILVNQEIPNLTNLSPPSSEDRALANSLNPNIKKIAFEYLSANGYQNSTLRLVAARKLEDFVLLDISTGKADGNVHLIYSLKQRAIKRIFVWYIQG